jgi:hypothetical protein
MSGESRESRVRTHAIQSDALLMLQWGIVDQDDDLAKVERHVQLYPPPE